jgi:hypothetical protein
LRASRCGAVATYGDAGRDPGGGGFRVSFGLVKEIAGRGPSPGKARLRELVDPVGCDVARLMGVGTGRVGAPDYSQAWAPRGVGPSRRGVGTSWETLCRGRSW